MVEAAKASETGAMDRVEENAGRSTEFVKGNLAALQSILDEAQQITAQIDVLTNDAFKHRAQPPHAGQRASSLTKSTA